MNADGTNPTEIEIGIPYALFANWSPDGTKLVFAARGKKGWLDLYVVKVDGSGFTPLTNTSI